MKKTKTQSPKLVLSRLTVSKLSAVSGGTDGHGFTYLQSYSCDSGAGGISRNCSV